jgi:isoquinoline 1-oxidoreductase subunit beta
MKPRNNISRRAFLRQAGLSGVALTLGCYWPTAAKNVQAVVRLAGTATTAIQLMAWISIDGAGKVTIFCHRSEMGQGTWQSVPQIIAEELEVNLDNTTIQYAQANPQQYGVSNCCAWALRRVKC